MKLQERIHTMWRLGEMLKSGSDEWAEIRSSAHRHNPWFTPAFVDLAMENIIQFFLQEEALVNWAAQYENPEPDIPKNVGLIMAGNIPLVGFHDLLSVFISGHRSTIKPSSKDHILLPFIWKKIHEISPTAASMITLAETLKGCDAYMATGSQQSAQHFEYYFSKYPHIIRANKTSIAVLTGNESAEELDLLSDDIHLYFGLGCRNVTKIMVPAGYDFQPLLKAFTKYAYFREHHPYANNYDYRLAALLISKIPYMATEHLLLVENVAPFSNISMLHYEYYSPQQPFAPDMHEIQCLVGNGGYAFGAAQKPSLTDYADGVDTMEFLRNL